MIAEPNDGTVVRATVACPFCTKLNRVDLRRAADRPRCGECQKPLLLDRPLTATDATLDRILADTDVPVLVDFYADWCGPCKTMAPVLDEIARARTGTALILKLDTDRNPASASRFGIRGIPTLIVFRNGRESQRQVGGVPRAALEAMLG
jgi:thioredoxin 2